MEAEICRAGFTPGCWAHTRRAVVRYLPHTRYCVCLSLVDLAESPQLPSGAVVDLGLQSLQVKVKGG